MKRVATAYGAGLLFGVGLVVSGMVDPRNVVAFLDFGGQWNPALAAVMVGAIGTQALLLRWLDRRRRHVPFTAAPAPAPAPVLAPTSGTAGIDRPLIVGSAIFGVGWGLSGYCPGPAIVSLGFGAGRAWLFVAATIVGGLLAEATTVARSPRTAFAAD